LFDHGQDEVCWSAGGGMNMPCGFQEMSSLRFALCAQKVVVWIKRASGSRFEILGLDLCRVLA
jgi:hypothetical protein